MNDKNKFWIDRQFGVPIWVETDDKGIVIAITNEKPKYIARMEEQYKGKPVTFLKEDFEARMKPSFHCVHSAAITAVMAQVQAVESRIAQLNQIIASTTTPEDQRRNAKIGRSNLQGELNVLKPKVKAVRDEMKAMCNWTAN